MLVSADDDPRKAGTIWTLGPEDPTTEVQPLAAASFGRILSEGAAELAAEIGPGADAEIRRRLDSGRRCYAAWVDGALAAYGWVSFDNEFIGELRLEIELQPGEGYIWDCVTLPEYRQKRLYSALLVYIARELRREPLCRIWIGANLDNLPSQKGMARAGFREVAHLAISRVLAMRLVWVQGAPGAPDELVAEARRVFLKNRDSVWLAALASAGGG
jgi:ribosomal protein S18 acetylase RimI-like enzyme